MDQLAEVHHSVIGLNDGVARVSRRVLVLGRINTERKLGFSVIFISQSLKKNRGEARACTTTDGVKDHETLHRVATLRNFT